MANTKSYPEADPTPNFPAMEQETLARWERDRTFEQQMAMRPKTQADGSSNEFVFYDGPPFANGLPHYGHIATGFVKDIVPRYQSMRGRHVDRRFGWDCHGLPAELAVEKEIQVAGRSAIIAYGIAEFNEQCRLSVQRYTEEWEWYVNRSGRWVSFENGYRTMDRNFMESVLWAFKALFDKGLIYEGFRVVPYSWAVQSTLSNSETRLDDSFRNRTDPALTVAFRLTSRSEEVVPINLVAWTTTPWTLPANLAIAVHPDLTYVAVQRNGVWWVLAEAALGRYQSEFGEATIAHTFQGEELVGRMYEPLFPYFSGTDGAFRVLGGDFITVEDGTGIVHLAPGFGEEDLALCQANGVPVVVPVDDAGRFTAVVAEYQGQNVIHEGNASIIRDLKARRDGTVVRHDQIVHAYPHCWRTDEPLIYKAINGWYVAVSQFKDRMVELNQGISWTPSHIRDGAFGKWLENQHDWNISRNRFWGTPIPVWRSDDPAYPRIDVYGSVAELERDFAVKIENLHRPFIDNLVRPNPDDPTGRSMMHRIPDVLDCWFESGSMPFAQQHYPFENRERFDRNFPGDFIVEYVAQTRGWFNSLMVLSTALFDRAPFQNCVCHGVVLDEKGQKLSKRLQNYPDPMDVLSTYGADALRWYMMSSPLMAGGNLMMGKDGKDIGKAMRPAILRLWNAYVFFTLYANIDGVQASLSADSTHPLDDYVLTKVRQMIETVQKKLDVFDIPGAYSAVTPFVDALNNWYIRNRRSSFWASGHSADKQAAYNTLYTCLVRSCQALAPLLPFVTEKIYMGLTSEQSVHLSDWPDIELLPCNSDLIQAMDLARDLCSATLNVREDHHRRVRLPLSRLVVFHPESSRLESYKAIIAEEVNVKHIALSTEVSAVGTREIRVNPSLGKIHGARMKEVFAAQRAGNWRERHDGKVEIGPLVLDPGQFEIKINTPHGMAAQSFDQGRGVVVLDVTVTDELQAEGWARDVVRLIQNARKIANLHLTDRISAKIQTHGLLKAAIHMHRDVISNDTLAAQLELEDEIQHDTPSVVVDSVDGQEIRLSISKYLQNA
jgi:isoleucyl-tRNA synthetase